jgi:outer membrane receptor protein involved in Fe transport
MDKGKFRSNGSLGPARVVCGVLCLGLSSGAAIAQQSEDPAVEEITVTGTRLTQQNLVSSTAVNVFDTEAIDISGATNMSELIRTLPATGVSTLTTTNSNFLVNSSGINTVELRNLGEDRTLVLVNGRRFVAGVPGSQIVDFNSIPAAFIERIDVVTGGASAVYGSDAVAGVVNIITNKDFQGVQLTGQGGQAEAGDNEKYTFSLTAGMPFADDRGHAMFSYTYDKENGVYARDRDGMEVDGANLTFFSGDANDYAEDLVPFYSSFSEYGRMRIPNDGNYVFDGTSTIPFVSDDHGFNRQAYRALAVPLERNLLAANFDFDLSDNVNLFLESTYSSVDSESSLEPFPMDSESVYGQFGPQCEAGVGCSFGIPGSNPFIPADMLQIARDANPGIADDDLVIGFARRMTELDQRGASNLRQTFRVVGGLQGSFADDRFDYELSYNFGRTTQSQASTGQVNVLNMRYSLDAIVDPDDPTNIICRDGVARAQGCIPVNLFGLGSITAGLDDLTRDNLLTYLKSPGATQGEVEQNILMGFISGDMFEMPAGTARFVVGAEYRDEQSSQVQDSLAQQGLNAGNKIPPTVGGYDVIEGFLELELPLLGDIMLVDSLDLNLAARFSDYSTVGNTEAFAGSIKYRPVEDLLVRGQLSRAVRAPNISELFAPLSQTFPPGLVDPCEGVTVQGGQTGFLNEVRNVDDPDSALNSGINPATVNDPAAVACMQDPSVAARVSDTGGLVLTQPEIQGVSGFNGGAISGGNTLDAETADTVTAGFVWSPSFASWADGLTISVDYYLIEIEDGISSVARQTSLNRCYESGTYDANTPFCQNVVRFDQASGPSVGAWRFINAYQQNLSTLETSGIDLQASYSFDLPRTWGSMDLTLTYSNLQNYETVPFEGEDPVDDTGQIGLPEHEGLLGIVYSRSNLLVAWSTQWLGSVKLDEPGGLFDTEISDRFFHDIQGRYTFGDNWTVVLGVDNVADEYVPIGFFGPGTSTGWNTAPDFYDGLGRRYYAGLRLDF